MPESIRSWRRSSSVRSFGYAEVARGKSVVDFYGGITSGSNTFISNVKSYSSKVGTVWPSGTPRDGLVFDIDFTRSVSIEGTVIINAPFFVNVQGAHGVTIKITGRLEKVTGGTATILGDWTGDTGSANNILDVFMATGLVTISKTRFKRGDTLRARISGSHVGAAGGDTWGILHDPFNTGYLTNTEPTRLAVQLPFNTDV